jgi:hypothetical protein
VSKYLKMKLKKMFQHCQWLWMWRGIVVSSNGYYAKGWGLNLAWPYFMKTTSLLSDLRLWLCSCRKYLYDGGTQKYFKANLLQVCTYLKKKDIFFICNTKMIITKQAQSTNNLRYLCIFLFKGILGGRQKQILLLWW